MIRNASFREMAVSNVFIYFPEVLIKTEPFTDINLYCINIETKVRFHSSVIFILREWNSRGWRSNWSLGGKNRRAFTEFRNGNHNATGET